MTWMGFQGMIPYESYEVRTDLLQFNSPFVANSEQPQRTVELVQSKYSARPRRTWLCLFRFNDK